MIKGNDSLVENFNFNFLTPLSHNFEMLHFDAHPWQFEHCFCQYLKNNISDIRLIPLDYVTISFDEDQKKCIKHI